MRSSVVDEVSSYVPLRLIWSILPALEFLHDWDYNHAMAMLEKDHPKKAPTVLTPAELAAIDEAEPYEAGQGMSLEEAHDLARQRTHAWMNINPIIQ
jgi:hypothetical protein